MPQDGANNYQYPLGTPGIPDQTIESEAYNTFLDDLVTNDLNIARPIHRGGTGATTATAARTALDAEVAAQVVTNYDSHVWESGSFVSQVSAIGGPADGNIVTGFSVVSDDNQNITLMAIDHSTSDIFFRIKSAGVWTDWSQSLNDVYVNIDGDTMTGHLALPTGPAAEHAVRRDYVDAADAALQTDVDTAQASADTAQASADNKIAKTGGIPDGIMSGDLYMQASPGGASGTIRFGYGTAYLHYDATAWILFGGAIRIYGDLIIMEAAAYKPGGGLWADSSDARIKNVLGNYSNGLASIKSLQPVRYTFKGNYSTQAPDSKTIQANVLDKEFIGLIAQDAEIPMPEMVTQTSGWIDGTQVNDLRVLDPSALIYALVNSVKELAARVEQLEAAG